MHTMRISKKIHKNKKGIKAHLFPTVVFYQKLRLQLFLKEPIASDTYVKFYNLNCVTSLLNKTLS